MVQHLNIYEILKDMVVLEIEYIAMKFVQEFTFLCSKWNQVRHL